MKLDQNELVMLKLCILKITFPILISSMTLGSDLKTSEHLKLILRIFIVK